MDPAKSLRIGKTKTKNRLFLSPMVDVTDAAYREICRKCGAGMAYTEMIYVDAILHENEKTKKMMKLGLRDRPVGLQITGNNEEEFEQFVKGKYWKDFDLIDINCGCPSIRITGNEAGSYLLRNPERIGNMIRILKKTGKTITVKIRLGFYKNNVLEVAKIAEKAGVDALTLHARLATQAGSMGADWKWIAKVKKAIKIPVIGNGDVFSGKDAKRMFRETKCDAIMIARGAIGDPLIFSRILEYFETGKESEKDWKENLKLFREYLKLARRYKIDEIGHVKYLGGNFLRGFKGAAKLRGKFMQLKSFKEIRNFIYDLILRND